MKKRMSIFTVVFIVGVLFMTSGTAMAAWTATPAAINVASGANPGLLYAVNPGNAAAGIVALGTYTLSGAESLDSGAFVTITLTGGAVFGANAIAASYNNTPGAFITMMTGSGGAGSTEAKFRTSVFAGSPGAILFTSNSSFNIAGVTPGSNVDVLITLTTSAGTVITTNASMRAATGGQYMFTGVKGVTFTGPAVATRATVDVLASPAYSKFLNSSLTGAQGTIGIAAGGNAATVPAAGIAAKKTIVTLTGDFKGITKVTCTGLYGSDNTGSTTLGLAGQFYINSAMTEAYATTATEFNGVIAVNPIFFVDGTTVQAQRMFTTKVENLVDANYTANVWQAAIDNYRIVRNGVFFSANSLGPLNNIKISDLSGVVPTGGAKILISAWDAAGVKLADASGLTDVLLQNNATVILTGTEIAARFVGTPMKYEVAIQSLNATLSNIKKDPVTGGITSTVYVPVDSGGGAL